MSENLPKVKKTAGLVFFGVGVFARVCPFGIKRQNRAQSTADLQIMAKDPVDKMAVFELVLGMALVGGLLKETGDGFFAAKDYVGLVPEIMILGIFRGAVGRVLEEVFNLCQMLGHRLSQGFFVFQRGIALLDCLKPDPVDRFILVMQKFCQASPSLVRLFKG